VIAVVREVSVHVQVRIHEVIQIQIQVVTVEINRVPIVCIHDVVHVVVE
jgi:hypothetical protein